MRFNPNQIRDAIEQAAGLSSYVDGADAKQIAFHMTDWLEDLERYLSFCEAPESSSSEQLEKMLFSFLIHAPNHIAAAAVLLTGTPVSDIFNVGAVSVKNQRSN